MRKHIRRYLLKLYEIGSRVKELRKEQGYTQEDIANKAGISRVTFGKFERGQMGVISIKTLDIILDTLNYEIDIKKQNSDSFGLTPLNEIGYE